MNKEHLLPIKNSRLGVIGGSGFYSMKKIDYLREIDNCNIENIAAPQIAIDYWNLSQYARLRDVVIAVRNDEMGHRDVNHQFVAILDNEAIKPDIAQGSEIKNKK